MCLIWKEMMLRSLQNTAYMNYDALVKVNLREPGLHSEEDWRRSVYTEWRCECTEKLCRRGIFKLLRTLLKEMLRFNNVALLITRRRLIWNKYSTCCSTDKILTNWQHLTLLGLVAKVPCTPNTSAWVHNLILQNLRYTLQGTEEEKAKKNLTSD